MKRLWLILTLLLSACATPTEHPPPADTPTPTQPSPTSTATAPTSTPTIAPTDTPSGPPPFSTLLFDAQEVWREAHIASTGQPPIDLHPDLEEAGDCQIDCAALRYPSDQGAYHITITLIAFEDEVGADARVGELAQESLSNGAREVTLSEHAVGVDYLPSGTRVFYLDQSWSVFAPYGNIFVGVVMVYTIELSFPAPEDDVISFSHLNAQVASAQIERLIEAGY